MTIGMPPPNRDAAVESPSVPAAPAVAAGWYPDGSSERLRYWDGLAWTEQFAPAAKRTNVLAALSLGLVPAIIVSGFLVFPALILAAASIVLGVIGLRRSSTTGSGRGLALAGIVTSSAISIILIVITVLLVGGTSP